MTDTSRTASPLPDPWQIQRDLMAASDQLLPASPELNKGVILYGALILEEASEAMNGLVKALERVSGAGSNVDAATAATLGVIAAHLAKARDVMHTNSVEVRDILKKDVPDDLNFALEEAEVIEMADGTTDSVVVNSGFALSLGIPGAACYADVAGSNLSKRNPDTLRIDKTPDGKWIKGRDYREPNLKRVIFG